MIAPPSNAHLREQYQQCLLEYADARGYHKQTQHVPFTVSFRLASPYAGYGVAHLDALIALCVVAEALRGAKLPNSPAPYRLPLPLTCLWQSERGIPLFHATSLFATGKSLKGVSYWTKRNDSFASQFAQRKKDGTAWQPDGGAGVYKEYLMPLPTLQARCLVAHGVGDMQEIARLLQLLLVTGVGKKVGTGFGQVLSIDLSPYTLPDDRRHVIVSNDGRLLRPVPKEALAGLGYRASPGAVAAAMGFASPYWLPANQAMCYHEQTLVEQIAQTRTGSRISGTTKRLRSVADVLLFCEHAEAWSLAGSGLPVDIVLSHPRRELLPDEQIDALSGLPIDRRGGAVRVKDVLTKTLGNAVDFLKAPGSPWLSHASALILSQPKKFHRSLVALIAPDAHSAHLLWPTVAVDPTNPKQDRPLWREVILDLASRYLGYQCVLLYKDEPKSRLWPRCRVGVVGAQTPFYLADSALSVSSLMLIDVIEVRRQLLCIEAWLDAGYTRRGLRTGDFSVKAEQLTATLAVQRELAQMHQTSEFLLAWRFARSAEERQQREEK